MNLAYYIFVLIIIFFLSLLMKKNLKLSPKKIKIYICIVISIYILRYIGLFMLCILNSTRMAYCLKSFLYLNHLAIVLMVLGLSYVYLRWERVKFNTVYFISAIITFLYCIGIHFVSGKVSFNPGYGYIITIKNQTIIYLLSLIIYGILLCFCIYYYDKPHNNRLGMVFLILALIIVIIENVLYIGGVRIFPYPVLGDAIFILIMNFALNTFKKNIHGEENVDY